MDVAAYLRGTECDLGLSTAKEWVEAAKGDFVDCDLKDYLPESWARSQFVFRGQKNSGWGLRPSLHRTIVAAGKPLTEANLARAERAVIAAAREGVGSSPHGVSKGSQLGLNLTDGQLLALLQHQESPTRFLDVSMTGLIGLFFACEAEDRLDGRVFVVALPADSSQDEATSDYRAAKPWLRLNGDHDLPWPEVRTERNANGDWTTSVCLVDAGGLDPRMSAQRGVFLVGGLARSYGGMAHYWSEQSRGLLAEEIAELTSLQIYHVTGRKRRMTQPFPAFARTLRVPAELKSEIRRILEEDHGIAQGSVYPDFAGFRRLAHNLAARA